VPLLDRPFNEALRLVSGGSRCQVVQVQLGLGLNLAARERADQVVAIAKPAGVRRRGEACMSTGSGRLGGSRRGARLGPLARARRTLSPRPELELAPPDRRMPPLTQAERFMNGRPREGHRCVLLIHGRGLHSGASGPALRPALVESLSRQPLVKHVLASPRPLRFRRQNGCADRASATPRSSHP